MANNLSISLSSLSLFLPSPSPLLLLPFPLAFFSPPPSTLLFPLPFSSSLPPVFSFYLSFCLSSYPPLYATISIPPLFSRFSSSVIFPFLWFSCRRGSSLNQLHQVICSEGESSERAREPAARGLRRNLDAGKSANTQAGRKGSRSINADKVNYSKKICPSVFHFFVFVLCFCQ